MKADPACFEQQVCHGWCLLRGSGSNCDTQLLEFVLFKFFMFKWSEGEKRAKTGSFININIPVCERGREDLSGFAAFKPCCRALLPLFLFLLHPFFPSVFLCNFCSWIFNFLNILTFFCYSDSDMIHEKIKLNRQWFLILASNTWVNIMSKQ